MIKECERCNREIPEDYVNLLCDECYRKVEVEIAEKKEREFQHNIAQVKKNPDSPLSKTEPDTPIQEGTVSFNLGSVIPDPRFGIKDPDYRENPEADDKDQILANLAQFIYSHNPEKKRPGKMLWYPQRNMYTFIKHYCMKKIMSHPQYPKYLWKPDIVDVGCGSGVGSNILSQEANFVWGIDKNEFSLEFAKECFTREKNGFYYSGQLTFDQFDIMADTRETMKFNIVVAIEVIEHVYDTDKFLRGLIRFTRRNRQSDSHIGDHDSTEFFISSPNRAFPKLRKDRPENPFHVREWTSEELCVLLRTYFEEITTMNQKGEPVPEDTKEDEVVLFKCRYPKV